MACPMYSSSFHIGKKIVRVPKCVTEARVPKQRVERRAPSPSGIAQAKAGQRGRNTLREIGQDAADDGREMKTVPRARGADYERTDPIEHEVLGGCGRVKTRRAVVRSGIETGKP